MHKYVVLFLTFALLTATGCSDLDWSALFRAIGGKISSEKSEEHEHKGALAKESLEISLSKQALQNIDLAGADATLKLEAVAFPKTLAFPAIVTDFPGRTRSKVPSTVAGVVTKIYHEPGVSVKPGEPLFDIQLTHQDAVVGQLQLLQLLKKREILDTEIQRLSELPEGLVPQKQRELGFDKQNLNLEIENQKNTLVVQGLAAADIEKLMGDPNAVVRSVTIPVPPVSHHGLVSDHNPGNVKDWILVDSLNVSVGQIVNIGDPLCTLCDLCELAVRGEAFSFDEALLVQALRQKSPVTLVFEGQDAKTLTDLHLRSIENHIDPANRTLSCFVDIENTLDEEQTETAGDFATPRHYVHWQHKPGQRCEMRLEYETLQNVFVVPAEAVAKEVNDTFLFAWVGNDAEGRQIWKKTPVHVVYRAKDKVAIANDGAVFPGTKVAARGAEFLLAALNAFNQGGAQKPDPHAGCNH